MMELASMLVLHYNTIGRNKKLPCSDFSACNSLMPVSIHRLAFFSINSDSPGILLR